jgi:acetyltransferase-like isoleucine patch superfamily enzyme
MDVSNHKKYRTHGSGELDKKKFQKLGNNVIFETGVLVFHPENIQIADNVYIGHNTILKGYYKNEMIIGLNTWVGQNCFFHSAGGIYIGAAVGIGPMVKILTSAHQETNIDKPVLFEPLNFKKVILKDGCDIGLGTIILPGVTIGEGAIIGAGAVVTEDIPDYTVAVGSPAKVIRKR